MKIIPEISKTPKTLKRVAIYIRCSSQEQVDGFGLDSQLRNIQSLIQSHEEDGWITSNGLIFSDEGVSGATATDDRPGMSKLNEKIRNGEVDILCVWKIDRLFRKVTYLLEYIEWLKEMKVNFVSKTENIDLNSATGNLVLTLIGGIGELERSNIRDRTLEGKKSACLSGFFVYGKYVAHGYALKQENRGKKIIVDTVNAPIIKEIFDMYVKEKKSSSEIARILTARGIGTSKDREGVKKHTGLFRQSEVADILRNEAYIGRYYVNKRSTKRINGKQITVFKDRSEWILLSCEPIIDEAIFREAQERLDKGKIFHGRGEDHMFTGLLRCGCCGKAFHHYKVKKSNMGGKSQYRCDGRNKSKNSIENLCTNPGISEDKLYAKVFPKIEELLENPEDFILAYEAQENNNTTISHRNSIENQFSEIQIVMKRKESAKKNALMQSLEFPDEHDTYLNIIAEFSDQIEVLIKRKDELGRELDSILQKEKTYSEIRDTQRQLGSVTQMLTKEDKIVLLRKLVDVIIVNPQRVEVRYRF